MLKCSCYRWLCHGHCIFCSCLCILSCWCPTCCWRLCSCLCVYVLLVTDVHAVPCAHVRKHPCYCRILSDAGGPSLLLASLLLLATLLLKVLCCGCGSCWYRFFAAVDKVTSFSSILCCWSNPGCCRRPCWMLMHAPMQLPANLLYFEYTVLYAVPAWRLGCPVSRYAIFLHS